MKKNNKKASILLWSVMLSLLIAITFITISTKINKNIKSSGEIKNFIYDKNKINLAINSWSIVKISDNKLLINLNNKKRTFSLKKQGRLNLSFSWTSDFNIVISIINWWGLNYKYNNNNITSSSWIINNSNSFTGTLDSTNNTWSLNIRNLWWNTRFEINSENEFETWEKNYKIVTKIWNNFFNETKNDF